MSGTSEKSRYDHSRSDDSGLDQCVVCGVTFGEEGESVVSVSSGMNYTYGPVHNADTGAEYEYVGESPPGTYLAHQECFKEVDAERKAESNYSLGDFSGGRS